MTDHRPWTKQQLNAARKVLGRHTDLGAALAEIRRDVRNIQEGALRLAFRQAGIGSPSAFLKPPEAHPVDREAAKEQESRLRREHRQLVEELRDHRARAEAQRALSERQGLIKRRELGHGAREGTAVILASDWHVEETVLSESTPLANRYTLDVAETRIGRFFSGSRWLIDFHRPVFGLRDVVLWLGGDLITGYLHDELVEGNSLSPIQAARWVQRRIISGITDMLADDAIALLTIVVSHGNHGRTTQKPRRATGAQNSYEWLIGQQIADHFADDPRVQFVTSLSAHQYVKVYDFDLHFHHGDEANYGGGVGGISIPLNKATAQWDLWKRCDYHHYGHFHQYLDLGRVVVNGSLIGASPFGMAVKGTPEPPQQAFYVLDSKRGKTCKSPIWVSE